MAPRFWTRLFATEPAPNSFPAEPAVTANPASPADAQNHPQIQSGAITFAVDAVTPAEKPIWTETLADSLSRRFLRKILVLPDEHQQVINAERDSLDPARLDRLDPRHRDAFVAGLGSRCHPFIDAVHTAFSQHRPLELSPDAIWLLIAQGFSHHVAENSESLRHRLVRHQAKRQLQVKSFDLSLASFASAIAGFSSLIQQEIDPVLHETLLCDFSTTRPAMRTASEVALMDTFSSYFTYMLLSVCGIPRITLSGTSADWQRIRSRVDVLATFELEWWVARLRPILDEFVSTAEGHPSPDFWQAIYKPKDAYGGHVVTGWVTDLFPYLGDAPQRRRNHVFEYQRRNWSLTVNQGVETEESPADYFGRKGVGPKSFPSGLSSARVKVTLQNGPSETVDLDLVAGFLAVSQDPANATLAPLIGWCAVEPQTREIMID